MHQKNIELGKELLSVNEKLQNQIVTDECEDDKEIVTKNSTFSKYKRKLTSLMNAFIKKWGLLLLFIIIFEIVMFTIKNNLTGVRHAQFNRIQEVSSALIAMSLGSMLIWYRLNGLTIKWATLYKEIFKILLAIFLISSFSIWLFYYIYVPDGSIIVEICFLCFAIFMHLAIFLVLTTIVEKIIDFLLPNVDIYLLKSKKLHTIFCILAAFLFTTVGFVAVASPPTVKSIDLKIKNLPPSFEKFSISLITDIHIGPSVGQKRVKQIVDISNSLQPDVVTVVGDTVDGFLPYLSERALPLANLKSKYGTFAVTGNHEYYHSDIDKWIEFFQNQLNLTVLLNDHKIISKYQKSNETICIAGVDDYFTKRLFIDGHKMDPEKALSACPQNGTTILLVHQPHAAAKILDETNQKVDLVLSGHHHGGGLYISYPFAYFFVSYLHGLHKHLLTGTQIYISAGINYWGPAVKMIDFCEITLIRLIAEQ